LSLLLLSISLRAVPVAAFRAHRRRCLGEDTHACSVCEEPVERLRLELHECECAQRADQREEQRRADVRATRVQLHQTGTLTASQLAALQSIEQSAAALSAAAEAGVLARVQSLGYTAADLRKALAFVRDAAPIVIHVNLSKRMQVRQMRPERGFQLCGSMRREE
jgi:hypothetical protein